MPPFDTKMAHRHKKGLSDKQARQWAAVARSVYAKCVKDGGSAKTCEARAIRAGNGVTGEPALSTQQRFTINAVLTVPSQALTIEGCAYLSAPAVLLVCGVLNEALVTEALLVAEEWDYIPVLLNHPTDEYGTPISAQGEGVLDQWGIGHLTNCRLGIGYRNGQPVRSLQADVCVDLSRIEHLGGEARQVLERLQKQEPLELSTGFFAVAHEQPGRFLDTPYREILQRITPDHLALLPNGIGACSWDNGGCGLPRANKATCGCETEPCTCHGEDLPMPDVLPVPQSRLHRLWQVLRDFVHHEEAHALVVEQTDSDVREALQGALCRECDDAHEGDMSGPSYWQAPQIEAVDVATHTFTFYDEGQLKQRSWTVVDGVITLDPMESAVQRTTTYVTVPGTTDSDSSGADEGMDTVTTEQQEDSMAAPDVIKRRVDALIANERTRWSEGDRHMLEAQDEAFLIRLEQQPLELPVIIPQVEDPQTAEEAIALLPAHLQEMMLENYEDLMQRKTAFIETILANKRNPFTQAELEKMRPRRLQQLMDYGGDVVPGQEAGTLRPNYTGRRLPPLRIVQTEETEAPPAPPDTLSLVIEERKRMGLM